MASFYWRAGACRSDEIYCTKGRYSMKGFLDYQPGDTILHHMNPLAKLIMAVAII